MIRATRTLALFALVAAAPAEAQKLPAGWEMAGVPALNYDSDEGFGYGAVAELYFYGDGGVRPYVFTIQPTVQLSTRGKRDVTVFFDAPHLLPRGWRMDAFVGSEKHLATPFYGIGNDSEYDETLDADDGPDPYYYRFGRTRRQASVNLQHGIGSLPLRALVGAGVSRVTLDHVPFDSGTTLVASQFADQSGSWLTYARGGLVWDTRDREVGPTRGAWSELLVQSVDEALAMGRSYTRWTLTDRRYLRLGSDRLVFANRLLLQDVEGDAPFYDLYVVQTSFKQQEGLGGAKTLRGVPKNRYVGKGMFLWNAELRLRAAEFDAMGKPFHLVLSAFVDSGRVWEDGVDLGSITNDLHRGFGGGARLGMGENFTVALDVGHSEEATAPFYIGLGYLY